MFANLSRTIKDLPYFLWHTLTGPPVKYWTLLAVLAVIITFSVFAFDVYIYFSTISQAFGEVILPTTPRFATVDETFLSKAVDILTEKESRYLEILSGSAVEDPSF